MKMTKSITICALVVGLIGLFTAVARANKPAPRSRQRQG
jgi:hypothetical protein